MKRCGIRLGALLTLSALAAAFALVSSGCAHSEPFRKPPTVDLDERALNIWAAIRVGDALQMGRDFDPRVDRAFPKMERASFIAGLRQKYGSPVDIVLPRRHKRFEAVYPLHFEKGDLEMRLSANERFAVIGLTISPPKAAAIARNRTPLAYPLEGLSLVVSGDDGPDSNPRAEGETQRFAYEMLAIDGSGRVRQSPPSGATAKENSDYACFGRRVRAPASGVVTEAIDGVRDNRPGEPNPYVGLGNLVMIEHAPGEASVLAHLQRGSIKVKAGQKVRRGQVIGHCGNSGNSAEPSLHFHMQSEASLPKGTGVKASFERLKRYGRLNLGDETPERLAIGPKSEIVSDYAPVRGDVVEDSAGGASSGSAAGSGGAKRLIGK